MDQELLTNLLDSEQPKIDFFGGYLTEEGLDLILTVLKAKGRIEIVGVFGVNILGLGAHLGSK